MDEEISKIGRSLAEMRDSSMRANKKVGDIVRGRIETSSLRWKDAWGMGNGRNDAMINDNLITYSHWEIL